MLEVGSILKDRPLKRPVILLFNEGEELGLIGARAFLADPLSRNVDSLLNFEARGVTGPVTMFETSRPNAAAIALVRERGAAARRPSALDRRLSPDAQRHGRDDLQRARLAHAQSSRSSGTKPATTAPATSSRRSIRRSLQHMGDQALALASELAPARRKQAAGKRIFMDLFGRALIADAARAWGRVLIFLLRGIWALVFAPWRRAAREPPS